MSEHTSPTPGRRAARFSVASLRPWHAGISAFIAPMLLFYSLSGSLQIFDLHEAHGTYVPGPILSAIGRLHKDQVLAPVPPRPPQARPEKSDAPKAPKSPMRAATVALKILFLLEALAVAVTTLIGVWIGVTHPKYARRTWTLIGLGIAIPAILLLI
jgi:hypothetical protein